MKIVAVAPIFLSLFVSAHVHAQDGAVSLAPESGEVTVGGFVNATCTASGTFDSISVGNLLDNTTGGLRASQVNNKKAQNTSFLICNGVNSTLTVTANSLVSSGVLPAGAAARGFTNQVQYRATAALLSGGYSSDAIVATDVSDTIAITGAPDRIGLLAAPVNTLEITLSDAALPSGATFLLGDANYAGSVTLTFAAQL
jgi:hypothetical protein